MKFVIFEGPDYCGKSTLVTAVAVALEDAGTSCLVTHHPGATPLGREIRKLTKSREDIEIDRATEQLLLACDLNAFKEQILLPKMSTKDVVIADRCNAISGFAYGMAGGIDLESLVAVLKLIALPKIDLLIRLSCPYEELVRRREAATDRAPCKFETRGGGYQERVWENYEYKFSQILELSPVTVDQYVTLDALKSTEELTSEVIRLLHPCLENAGS